MVFAVEAADLAEVAPEGVGNMNILTADEQARVEAAIAAAESHTSGELRVVLYPGRTDDAVAAAKEEFVRLGMDQTRDRNAVLILLAPASRAFAVIGDAGIHARCGERFWTEIARAMESDFQQGAFADGLIRGVDRCGQLLADLFPRRDDDVDELSNRVVDRGIVI